MRSCGKRYSSSAILLMTHYAALEMAGSVAIVWQAILRFCYYFFIPTYLTNPPTNNRTHEPTMYNSAAVVPSTHQQSTHPPCVHNSEYSRTAEKKKKAETGI